MHSMSNGKSAQGTVIIQSEGNDIKVHRNRGVFFLIFLSSVPHSLLLSPCLLILATKTKWGNKDNKGKQQVPSEKGATARFLSGMSQRLVSECKWRVKGKMQVLI